MAAVTGAAAATSISIAILTSTSIAGIALTFAAETKLIITPEKNGSPTKTASVPAALKLPPARWTPAAGVLEMEALAARGPARNRRGQAVARALPQRRAHPAAEFHPVAPRAPPIRPRRPGPLAA